MTTLRRSVAPLILLVLLAAAMLLGSVPALAGSASSSYYTYIFTNDGIGCGATSPNEAVHNTGAVLNLGATTAGDWTRNGDCSVTFSGNQNDPPDAHGSVGNYPRFGGGGRSFHLLSADGSQGLGAAIRFTVGQPNGGGGCFGDSVNLTQVGRAGTSLSELKLQLSACSEFAFPRVECRAAVNGDPMARTGVNSSLDLSIGQTYVATCVKSPDGSDPNDPSHSALLMLKVHPVAGSGSTTDTGSIENFGPTAFDATGYLTVADKCSGSDGCPPTGSLNSDQFVGTVLGVTYCVGAGEQDTASCLAAQIGLSKHSHTIR